MKVAQERFYLYLIFHATCQSQMNIPLQKHLQLIKVLTTNLTHLTMHFEMNRVAQFGLFHLWSEAT